MSNRSKGTFEAITRGDANAASRWASEMKQQGFTHTQTYEIVRFRTGLEVGEWDELRVKGGQSD